MPPAFDRLGKLKNVGLTDIARGRSWCFYPGFNCYWLQVGEGSCFLVFFS